MVSRWPLVLAYLDLPLLVGKSQWIEDPAELEDLLPRQSRMKTRLVHWYKLAF